MEITRTVTLSNRYGLHARSSTRLAQIAQQFKASIRVAREGNCEEVDAKSILAILTLGAQKGQSLFLRADGDDAEEAVAAMVRLIEENFGEDQGNRSEE